MDKDFDDIVDLSKYSIEDSCLWLLSRLDADKHASQPYAHPYRNYVMSWSKAIPLNAIIMAQSPYPNAIYPEVAAAMSFDREKCRRLMRAEAPPTVRILANDLNIHTDMRPEDVDTIVKDGWCLVDGGILLVNSAVFCPYGTVGAYDECMNQINVLVRMLVETEKFGKRTVDIIAYGAGQAMASELTKCFRSDIIKLTKFSSAHPASLSYRMTDFESPECHLNAPSVSRTLAKHFSNHVAFAHTMAKKSDAELKAQRQLDTIRSLGHQLAELKEACGDLFPAMKDMLKHLEEGDTENFATVLRHIVHTGDTFVFRLGTASAALSQAQASTGGTGNTVAKPGPSMSTTSPSMQSLSQHVGGDFKAASPMAARSVSIRRSGSTQNVNSASVSDAVNVSSPPSVMSGTTDTTATNTTSPRPVVGKSIKIRRSTPTTRTLPIQEDKEKTPTPDDTPTKSSFDAKMTPPQLTDANTSSTGARFRKLGTIQESTTSGSTSKREEKQGPNDEWKLNKDVINHLSCVATIVEIYAPDKSEDDDVLELLDGIQSDIQNKFAYNGVTQRLAAAIRQDMDTDAKFDLSKWLMDAKKPSAAFDQCKEEFEF